MLCRNIVKRDAKKRGAVLVATRQLNKLDAARFVVLDKESIQIHFACVARMLDWIAKYRVHFSATRSESNGTDSDKWFDGEFDHDDCIQSGAAVGG